MEKHFKFSSYTFPVFKPLSFILILILFSACMEKRMSVEEAKEVTIAISDESIVPPPRRIEDIITFLDEKGQPETAVVERLKARADALPPENAGMKSLARFYNRRGFAAWELGRDRQALEDYRLALEYAERSGRKGTKILIDLAKAEKKFGNFGRAKELLERTRMETRKTGMFNNLVSLYAKIGDIEKAKEAKIEGLKVCNKPKNRLKPSSIQHASDMEATIFELEGKWKKAEPHIRKSLDTFSEIRKQKPAEIIGHRVQLINNLRKQKRLLEAELEARLTLKEAVQHSGKGSNMTWRALDALGMVVLGQGRLEDAEKLIRAEIRFIEDSGFSDDSQFMIKARLSLGNILAARGEFGQAMEQYDLGWKEISEDKHFDNRWFGKKQNMMLSLIIMGRAEEAMTWLSMALEQY